MLGPLHNNKTRIAHLSGPTTTIQNTPPLVTSNKARAKSSAWASRVAGTSRPRALAVLSLMTSSNAVGWRMGNSEAPRHRDLIVTLAARHRLPAV